MKSLSRNAQLLGFILARVGTMGVTRLVKLLYLTDLESRRLRGRPVSSLRFHFHHYGPYDREFATALNELKNEHLVAETPIVYPNGSNERQIAIQSDVPVWIDPVDLHILAGVCDVYGKIPLSDLLSIVYETPPMRGLERGCMVPMEKVDNEDRDEIGFDIEALISAKREAEGGNYTTGTDFFNALRTKVAARS